MNMTRQGKKKTSRSLGTVPLPNVLQPLPEVALKLPKTVASIGDATGGVFEEVQTRLPEFVTPLKFFAVAGGWTGLDLFGHQFFDVTAGDKTPPGYYEKKMIWAVPALALGRIVSDFMGGPQIFRAFTIGTVANSLMQLRYLFTRDKDFNLTVFILHETILVPLSLLIAGKSRSDLLAYGKGS